MQQKYDIIDVDEISIMKIQTANEQKSTTNQPGQEVQKLSNYKTLAISYFNQGIEYEYLKMTGKALESFQKGILIAQQLPSDNNEILGSLSSNYQRLLQ